MYEKTWCMCVCVYIHMYMVWYCLWFQASTGGLRTYCLHMRGN